jgi:hypothetical protein
MTDRSLVAVCGDPGGAEAVAPVLATLRATPGLVVHALTYRQACDVFDRHRIPREGLADRTSVEDAQAILRERKAGLLFTGTSLNGLDLEKRFLLAGRTLPIPSLAVLDYWSNYRVRFSDASGALTGLPDKIAIMDEQARREMREVGFEDERLVVTGQPAFDRLAGVRRRCAHDERESLRSRLGLPTTDLLVLFASQPISSVFGKDASCPLYPGYTEQDVLEQLVSALKRIAARAGKPMTLLIRPHPRETDWPVRSGTDHGLRTILSPRGDAVDELLAADLVVGMTTVLLVEACLLGCVVVSLQPNLRLDDTLPTNRQGYSRPVYRDADIEPTIEALLMDGAARTEALRQVQGMPPPGGAARRVADLARSLLSR